MAFHHPSGQPDSSSWRNIRILSDNKRYQIIGIVFDDAADESTPPQRFENTDKKHGLCGPKPAFDFKKEEETVAVNLFITVAFQKHSPGNDGINVNRQKPSSENNEHTA